MNKYEIALGTGLVWVVKKEAEGFYEQDALDNLVDELENENSALVYSYEDIEDLCDENEDVEQYVCNHNLVCAGNHCLYVDLQWIRQIDEKGGDN